MFKHPSLCISVLNAWSTIPPHYCFPKHILGQVALVFHRPLFFLIRCTSLRILGHMGRYGTLIAGTNTGIILFWFPSTRRII